jgi:5-aminopentanamidase
MTDSGITIAVAGRGRPAASAAAAARVAGADLLILLRSPEAPPEPSDGALAHAMGELAASHAMAVLFSYVEACSGRTHLALQLVLADGRSTANYRATHIGAAERKAGWSPGNWLTMARLEPLTLGLLAGLDHLAPEVGRALSALGAEALIAVSDAVLEPDVVVSNDLMGPLAQLRAIENGIPCCMVGHDGTTRAAAGDGTLLLVEQADGLALVTLVGDDRAHATPRRPDLYHQLVEGEPT